MFTYFDCQDGILWMQDAFDNNWQSRPWFQPLQIWPRYAWAEHRMDYASEIVFCSGNNAWIIN